MLLNFFLMNKNVEVFSIIGRKISSFGPNMVEIYNFLFGQWLSEHPVVSTFFPFDIYFSTFCLVYIFPVLYLFFDIFPLRWSNPRRIRSDFMEVRAGSESDSYTLLPVRFVKIRLWDWFTWAWIFSFRPFYSQPTHSSKTIRDNNKKIFCYVKFRDPGHFLGTAEVYF
jgi:hypothetical protein